MLRILARPGTQVGRAAVRRITLRQASSTSPLHLKLGSSARADPTKFALRLVVDGRRLRDAPHRLGHDGSDRCTPKQNGPSALVAARPIDCRFDDMVRNQLRSVVSR